MRTICFINLLFFFRIMLLLSSSENCLLCIWTGVKLFYENTILSLFLLNCFSLLMDPARKLFFYTFSARYWFTLELLSFFMCYIDFKFFGGLVFRIYWVCSFFLGMNYEDLYYWSWISIFLELEREFGSIIAFPSRLVDSNEEMLSKLGSISVSARLWEAENLSSLSKAGILSSCLTKLPLYNWAFVICLWILIWNCF